MQSELLKISCERCHDKKMSIIYWFGNWFLFSNANVKYILYIHLIYNMNNDTHTNTHYFRSSILGPEILNK